MFPRGLPGLALLLLRASVATSLLLDACHHRQALSFWIQVVAILAALAVSAGFLTPISSLIAVVVHVVAWYMVGPVNVAIATIVSLDALALTLVGPGAYSVDSFRYGRRVVVLP